MVIATQPIKKQDNQEKQLSEEEIEKLINSGGKSTLQDPQNKIKNNSDEIKFTLRIPKKIIEQIDKLRSNRAAKLSRNTWILDILERALEKIGNN